MATLDTLIRLAKEHVDEARQEVSKRELLVSKIKQQQAELTAQMQTEAESVRGDPQQQSDYAAYYQAALKRQHSLAKALQMAEAQVLEARDILRDCFAEQKRYEIALENQKAEAKLAAERLERQVFDEQAAVRWQREE